MTRVLINGRFLGQRVTGVQRYARELLKALDHLLSSDDALRHRFDFEILTPPGCPRSLRLESVGTREVGRFQGQVWEQLELPRYAGNTLLLSLCNTAPMAGRNIIATILDASVYAVPEAYSLAFRAWYRILIPVLGRRSRQVLTASEFSRAELQRFAGVDAEAIVVVPGSGEHILAVSADDGVLDRLSLRSRRYLLAVSSHSKHKNVAGVARATNLLDRKDFDVILAGGGNAKVFSQKQASGDEQIRSTGYVSDQELRALYEHASCLVYPSFYEGFGLPPLEAMSCGCPVIVSRAASLPEVCGEAAVYCDPHDPADIARAIGRVMADGTLRDDLRRRGRERARQFTWSGAARSLVDVIGRVVTR